MWIQKGTQFTEWSLYYRQLIKLTHQNIKGTWSHKLYYTSCMLRYFSISCWTVWHDEGTPKPRSIIKQVKSKAVMNGQLTIRSYLVRNSRHRARTLPKRQFHACVSIFVSHQPSDFTWWMHSSEGGGKFAHSYWSCYRICVAIVGIASSNSVARIDFVRKLCLQDGVVFFARHFTSWRQQHNEHRYTRLIQASIYLQLRILTIWTNTMNQLLC